MLLLPLIQFLPVYYACVQGGNVDGGQEAIQWEYQAFQDIIELGRISQVEGNWHMRGCNHMSTHSESCSVGLSMPLTVGPIPMGVFMGLQNINSSCPDLFAW